MFLLSAFGLTPVFFCCSGHFCLTGNWSQVSRSSLRFCVCFRFPKQINSIDLCFQEMSSRQTWKLAWLRRRTSIGGYGAIPILALNAFFRHNTALTMRQIYQGWWQRVVFNTILLSPWQGPSGEKSSSTNKPSQTTTPTPTHPKPEVTWWACFHCLCLQKRQCWQPMRRNVGNQSLPGSSKLKFAFLNCCFVCFLIWSKWTSISINFLLLWLSLKVGHNQQERQQRPAKGTQLLGGHVYCERRSKGRRRETTPTWLAAATNVEALSARCGCSSATLM